MILFFSLNLFFCNYLNIKGLSYVLSFSPVEFANHEREKPRLVFLLNSRSNPPTPPVNGFFFFRLTYSKKSVPSVHFLVLCLNITRLLFNRKRSLLPSWLLSFMFFFFFFSDVAHPPGCDRPVGFWLGLMWAPPEIFCFVPEHPPYMGFSMRRQSESCAEKAITNGSRSYPRASSVR